MTNSVRVIATVTFLIASLSACGGGGGGGGSDGNGGSVANQAPTANAGSDQTVEEESAVTLSGSGADSDGSIASYAWTQTDGISVTINNPDAATATFTAPTTAGQLTFQLVVTDDDRATGSDTVTITVVAPDTDTDNDKVNDVEDNCVNVPNGPDEPLPDGNQADMDGDGEGNACDDDIDGDTVLNVDEPSQGTNPRKFDTDGDRMGDGEDQCPLDWSNTHDSDGDGVCEWHDKFPNDPDEYADSDEDGIGNNADSDFSMSWIKVTPPDVFLDELSSATFKVEVEITGEGTPRLRYTEGPFGTGVEHEEIMYDDGVTHQDAVANDGVFTRTISGMDDRQLQYYEGFGLDWFSIGVYELNSITGWSAYVGIVDRANQCVPQAISESIQACSHVMNVKIHGYDDLKVHKTEQIAPMAAKEVFEDYPDVFYSLNVLETGRNLISKENVPKLKEIHLYGSGKTIGFPFHNTVRGVGLGVVPEDREFFGSTTNLRYMAHHLISDVILRKKLHEDGHSTCCFYSDVRARVTDSSLIHYTYSDQNDGNGHIMLGGRMRLSSSTGNFDEVERDPIVASVYGPLTLYTLGLMDPVDVPENYFAKPGASFNNGELMFDDAVSIPISTIVDVYGERTPSFQDSPKEFRGAIVFVSGNEFVSDATMAKGNALGRYYSSNACAKYIPMHDDDPNIKEITQPSFACATGFRGSMVLELPVLE